MGNPAEKTTRHPTEEINSILPYFGKYFFAFVERVTKQKGQCPTQLFVKSRFERDSRNRLPRRNGATGIIRKFLRVRMFRCVLASCFLHPIHQTRTGSADIWVARESISLFGDRFPAASANPITHFECGSLKLRRTYAINRSGTQQKLILTILLARLH